MRVGVGVLGGVVGGPASYGVRLVRALVAAGRDVTVFTDTPERFAGVAPTVALPQRGGLDRLRWQYWALGRALRRQPVDVFHDTKNALPLGFRGPMVTTVHDLAHVHCPETFGTASRWFLAAATRHAVARARAVIVPSEATARDVRAHWPAHATKVRVALHGIDPAPEVGPQERAAMRGALGIDGPFVLHVGTVQARKNVPLLCAGIALLRARGLDTRLVVAGRLGWKAGPSVDAMERTDGVRWVGPVSAEHLRALYAEATAFCSPSAYEGFGFTVADALAAGVPTVVSGISSLPEVVGDGGVVLPALTAEAIADALGALLADPERARALGAAGRERVRAFTWDAAARATAAVYDEVCAACAAR